MFARTTYVVVATPAKDRWFDLDAVRTGASPDPYGRGSPNGQGREGDPGRYDSNPAGAPPLDWHIDRPDPSPTAERHAMGNARLLIGDVHERLAELPDSSVDLVVTSPPFLALRSYLPADHPDKAKEIGSEPTPAAFLDTLLELTDEFRRVLTPYGSICVELGDTYAGSGGAGGDYGPVGLRNGQPVFDGSAERTRSNRPGQYGTDTGPPRRTDLSGAGESRSVS